MPFDVSQHATRVALEPTQCLAHPFELAGMGVTSDLTGQPAGEPVGILAKADPGLAGQPDQLATGGLVQPGIGWMGDILLHNRGIDGDPLDVVALYSRNPRCFILPALGRLDMAKVRSAANSEATLRLEDPDNSLEETGLISNVLCKVNVIAPKRDR